jgi:ATP-dependent helicase HrpA
LYPEQDFLSRTFFTPPEILRANLAEVILRMIALKLGNIEDFPFIERPATRSIRDGFDLLLELGAIKPVKRAKKSKAGKSEKDNIFLLTEKGRLMAQMPVDPRLSRMLIEADQEVYGKCQVYTLDAWRELRPDLSYQLFAYGKIIA